MTIFSKGTLELINDAAVNAIDEARRGAMPDWQSREQFIDAISAAAATAFDAIAEDQGDADPEGERPEFLG